LLKDYLGRNGQPLGVSSVYSHLASVRGHYQSMLRDNNVRQWFYNQCPPDLSPSDKKAAVDEILQRMANAIDAQQAPLKTVTRQDRPDEEHLRLTPEQAASLMGAPRTSTIVGLRDTAIISLLLCTGVREAELCALDVPDLQRRLGGAPALHVRRGKGAKERLVPYGALDWVLKVVTRWLSHAGITEGAVFRGFHKNKRVRAERLTTRSIDLIMNRYPILINGEMRVVNPHDLRRTYARQLYEAGVDLLAIRDNLGHSDSRTTLKYIGAMDIEKRKPPSLYTPPWSLDDESNDL
jgi:site-specific recombinase XerD